MRAERLDEDDSPDAESPAMSKRAVIPDSPGDLADDPGQPEAAEPIQRYEIRDPETYYEDLRAAVAADRREAANYRASAEPVDGPAQRDVYSGRSEASDGPEGRRGNDRPAIDAEVDAEVRIGCERIRETERTVITPGMREIEAADTARQLVGLDHRLKGEDRLKEKVTNMLRAQPDITTDQALTMIPDAVRFTFCYTEQRYASGVHADLERLHARGFELVKPLKNYWESDQYKGINSQWREPDTGQRFEVQFHTAASFEAKQDTHGAYELLRSPGTARDQQRELERFQREVCAAVPVPPGATEISDYPREKRDG
jgi:hypothetical protein